MEDHPKAKTIWKYPLKRNLSQRISMPKGAKILTMQLQAAIPCLWVEVDPSQEYELRSFAIYGTGGDMIPGLTEYIGTFQDGPYVLHVYTAA